MPSIVIRKERTEGGPHELKFLQLATVYCNNVHPRQMLATHDSMEAR